MKTHRINLPKALLLLLTFNLFSLLTFGQTTDSIDLLLKDKMQKLRIPALQLAVVQHGKLVKLKSYGIANLENSVPASDESIFSINSCTKAFVGVAIMQLQEEGKLNVNDPVSKYLDSLPVAWKGLTLKQLLSNSSGLPNIIDEYEQIIASGNEQAAWEMVKTLPMEFKPGEKFSYNQTGHVILGRIINQLSGENFSKFIEDRQFKVAGMSHTTFGDSYSVIPHSAGAYSTAGNINGRWTTGGILRNDFVKFPAFFRTAAGILSNAEDIASWIIALQDGRLLKEKSSLDILWTPAILNNGKVGGFNKLVNGYALGWPTVTREDHPAAAPVGGMRSTFFVYPKDDLSIVVLTNLQGANPEWFIDEIAAQYIPDMLESNGFGLSRSVKKLRTELIKQQYNNGYKIATILKKKDKNFLLTEDDLNDYGYRLLGEKKQDEALKVFKLYVDLYPQSGNAYDSYAESLAIMGDKAAAIKNYNHSLELNPNNNNAVEQLEKLKRL